MSEFGLGRKSEKEEKVDEKVKKEKENKEEDCSSNGSQSTLEGEARTGKRDFSKLVWFPDERSSAKMPKKCLFAAGFVRG